MNFGTPCLYIAAQIQWELTNEPFNYENMIIVEAHRFTNLF